MTHPAALPVARIFDGAVWHAPAVLRIAADRVLGIAVRPLPGDRVLAVPPDTQLVPGFVDLQVNGGGGAQFNADPSPESIARICAAHAAGGTTALAVTLISDRPEVTAAAIAAVGAARAGAQPGLLGLHLEGPHLAPARRGTHDPTAIRPMTQADLATIRAAREAADRLIVTVAPEAATAAQVAAMAAAGVIVSLGHSDADAATITRYADAGARMITHLFNAMSQIGPRSPGLVGAALSDGRLSAGIIADGVHVDPLNIALALRAKAGPGRIHLVTDAMAVTGTDAPGFTLNGRYVTRRDGRLTLDDGTLAGADTDMISSVRFLHRRLGLPLAEALRMAGAYPAEAAGLGRTRGWLLPGSAADFLLLSPDLALRETWIAGRPVHRATAAPPAGT